MKLSKEIKAAVLVLSGIFLFIYIFNYFKGDSIFNTGRVYYSEFDNVGGLAPSTSVSVNGLKIGKVQSIVFKGDGSAKLLVTLLIDSDFEFSKNSKVQLYDADLLGSKGVNILPAFDNAENAESGTTLLSINSSGGISSMIDKKIAPIQEKLELMLVDGDSLLISTKKLLDPNTQSVIKESIYNLNETIKEFKITASTLNSTLKDNKSDLENTISNVSKITDSISPEKLSSSLNSLDKSLKSLNTILDGINNAEGTLGKVAKDENLYNNLEASTKQLELLLEDFRLNPKRYVHFSLFGKKDKSKQSKEIE